MADANPWFVGVQLVPNSAQSQRGAAADRGHRLGGAFELRRNCASRLAFELRRNSAVKNAQLGEGIGHMAVEAAPRRAVGFARRLPRHMAVPAQAVELGFEKMADLR